MEKIPSLSDVGKKLEIHGLVKRTPNSSYTQVSDNCFEIARSLADTFGYCSPNSREELKTVLYAKRAQQIWGDKKKEGSPACFVIRGQDNPQDCHVTFEFKGREYNFGPRTQDDFPIERKIYLNKRK